MNCWNLQVNRYLFNSVICLLTCQDLICLPYPGSDFCGVCNGDNSTCQVTAGNIDRPCPYGYSDVIVIPEGAAMIEVTQHAYHNQAADDNYLGKCLGIVY